MSNLSKNSNKYKKYAFRKIGKFFGPCVIATMISIGATVAVSPVAHASDNQAGGDRVIEALASTDDGYEVFIPKGKVYVRNDEIESHEPKLKEEGYNGRSFILKAEPKDDDPELTENNIDDYFYNNPMGGLFEKLYEDEDGNGNPDEKYKRKDSETINADAGKDLNDPNIPGLKEPKVSEIDPKYPHRLDAGVLNPAKDDVNKDGKPDGADGVIDENDTIVVSNKPITVNPELEENRVNEDGTVELTKYYNIHVNVGEHAEKKDDIYEVGTKPKEKVETIKKSTNYIADQNIAYNTKETSVAGRDGSITTTTTYDLNENTGEVTPKEKVTTIEKEDEVVKVGNKEVITEKIAITTHYTADPTLEKDKQVTDNNGTEGIREITNVYEVSPTTGELSNPKRTENVTVAMVPKEVRVGNVHKEVEETEITTRYIPDITKPRDEKEIVKQGSKGIRTTTTTYSVDEVTGATHTPVTTVDNKPMVEKEVKVGIKPVETTEIIEITTKYVVDENLDYGKTIIDNEGSQGKIVTTKTYKLNEQDGTTSENEPTVQKTEMVQRVIRVGVKQKVENTPIPFETTYERDDKLPKGQTTQTTAGVEGNTKKTTTYTMDPTTGNVTPNEPTTETTNPVTRVIKVGTQPKVVTEETPSPKKYVKDPEREKGQKNEEVPGKIGTKKTTTTYEVDPKTGNITERVGEPEVVAPTETIIKVPAKDKVVTKDIPVVTEYEDDPTLETGKEEEKTPGQSGQTRTITTYTVNEKDGTITETTSTQTIKEMVKRIVKRGTKEVTSTQPVQPNGAQETPEKPTQPEQPSGMEETPGQPEEQPTGAKENSTFNVNPPTIAIVEELNKASIEVKAPEKDADTVRITYPKSDRSGKEVLILTKQTNGEWTLDKQPENVKLDKNTGTVTIPRESVVNKEKVNAQAKHKTSDYTPLIYAVLSIEEANPEFPVTKWVDKATGKKLGEVLGKKEPAGEIPGYKWLFSRLENNILTHTFEKVTNGTSHIPNQPESVTNNTNNSSSSTPEKSSKTENTVIRTVWKTQDGKELKSPSTDKLESGEFEGYEFVESHREGDNVTVHVFRAKKTATNTQNEETPQPEEKQVAVSTVKSNNKVEEMLSSPTSEKVELPNTGTVTNGFFTTEVATILAGLGILIPGIKKKKAEEK